MNQKSPGKGVIQSLGMLGVFFLSLALCGFLILLTNLVGLADRTERIPALLDYRPLVISTLGFFILGLTPYMLRLLFEGDPE